MNESKIDPFQVVCAFCGNLVQGGWVCGCRNAKDTRMVDHFARAHETLEEALAKHPREALGQLELGGVKHDEGKTPLGLHPHEALEEIGRVLAFGAKKYAAHNWRKGMAWSRLYDAALRHLLAWIGGEDKDIETGISHLAHAGCCLEFLIAYERSGIGIDDRWKAAT